MLDRHVIVLELFRLVLRTKQALIEPLRDARLAARAGARDLRDALQRRLRLAQEQVDRDLEPLEQAWDKAFRLDKQRVEKMLDINGLVAEPRRLILRLAEGRRRALGEFIQIHGLI